MCYALILTINEETYVVVILYAEWSEVSWRWSFV